MLYEYLSYSPIFHDLLVVHPGQVLVQSDRVMDLPHRDKVIPTLAG